MPEVKEATQTESHSSISGVRDRYLIIKQGTEKMYMYSKTPWSNNDLEKAGFTVITEYSSKERALSECKILNDL